jgi:adenylate cyclase
MSLALGALPGELVRQVAVAGAPLSRFGGRSTATAATLARALELLSKPPTRGRKREAPASLAGIAVAIDRPAPEVRRWARAGILGQPEGRTWGRKALERARLVDYLLRHGTPLEELERAAREDRLANVLLARALGTGDLSLAQVGAASGLPQEFVAGVSRALSLPPGEEGEAIYSERDLEAMRLLGALRGVFTDDDIMESASVVGRAMSEIAEASLELFRRRLAQPFAEAGVGDLELALRLASMVELLVPATSVLLESALRRHLEAAERAEAILELEREAGPGAGGLELAIGFADIVGFTALSAAQSPLQASLLAGTLMRRAEEILPAHGVRIVKGIGDAVMFSARETLAAAAAAADLQRAFAASGPALAREGEPPRDPPPLRVGIARGPVLRAYADYFGRTVNIASRLSDVAAPGTILVLRETPAPRWSAHGLRASRSRALSLDGIDGEVQAVTVAPAARARHARPGAAAP